MEPIMFKILFSFLFGSLFGVVVTATGIGALLVLMTDDEADTFNDMFKTIRHM